MTIRLIIACLLVVLANATAIAAPQTSAPVKKNLAPLTLHDTTTIKKSSAATDFLLKTRGISIGKQTPSDEQHTQGFNCELQESDDVMCVDTGWTDALWEGSYGGASYEVSVAKLERVVVEGQSFGPIEIIVCVLSCQSVYDLRYVDPGPILYVGGTALWQTIIDWLLPTPRVSACGPATTGYPAARNTTSHDTAEERKIGANAILNASIPPTHRLGMNGKDVQVMFSDGGTETYTFVAASSQHPAKTPSDLEQGTGVSKCPTPE